MEVYIIYTTTYVCKQSCGFIINGVIVKDEENANYYPARCYIVFLIANSFSALVDVSYIIQKVFESTFRN